MNFCKDCKHFVDLSPENLHIGKRCANPEVQIMRTPDPVTGHVDTALMHASLARKWSLSCGPDGKHFEAGTPVRIPARHHWWQLLRWTP